MTLFILKPPLLLTSLPLLTWQVALCRRLQSRSPSAPYGDRFSFSLSLPWFNNVSTKGARQANLFSNACSKAVCWNWPVGILLACRVELLSLLYVAPSRGSPPSWGRTIWGFVHSILGNCLNRTHWPTRPRRRCEPAACRMAREGPELCHRYQLPRHQGCWSAPRNATVQPSSARSDHDHAVESNTRSGDCLRRISASATCVIVAMWLGLRTSSFLHGFMFVHELFLFNYVALLIAWCLCAVWRTD